MSESGRPDPDPGSADALLVARIRGGDQDAFALLVGRYQAPLFHYLRGFIGDADQASDLVQETFLRAYTALGQLDDPALLRSWLYRIAHNLACSLLRRRRLISWLPLVAGRGAAAAAPDPAAIETAHVTAALAQLPADQRAPLLLHLVGGFSYAEIALLLRLSEGAVRMRISRGRAAFRAAYGPQEE